MKKKIMLVSTILICGIFLCGCGNAKLKDGSEVAFQTKSQKFSSEKLYKKIKKKYGVGVMIDMIDSEIFDKMYKDDADIEKQATTQLETLRTQYADSWDDTLKNAGYDSEDELKETFILSYQRNKAIEDYLKKNISEADIKNYYNENTVGDISAKHILIKVDTSTDDGLTDDEAKKKAEDLIKQLKDGADFDTLAKENSDDTGSKENGGDLGYFNKGDMVKEFEDAAYGLKVDEYTKEPVKTSYGYHIILKTGEKEKPKYKEVKDTIVKTMVNEKLEQDKTLNVTILRDIREDKGLKIKDSTLKKAYKKYIKEQIKAAEESNNAN